MLYFEKLIVWQKAMDLAVILVQIADSLPAKYQFSFGEQLRKAALSIASNIAEGSGRRGKRDQSNFYAISKGSVYESVNVVILLDRLSLLDKKRFSLENVQSRSEEVVKMLHALSS